MDSTTLLTELHFFGIPTQAWEFFPKGVPVIIRSVPATAEFCLLHPTVSYLSLVRVSDNEFLLKLVDDVTVTAQAIQDLVYTLVEIGAAAFPVSVRTESETAVDKHTTHVVSGTQITQHEIRGTEIQDSHVNGRVVTDAEFLIEVEHG